MVENIKAKGGTVTREPGPVKGGSTVIAFVKDPDGYLFEIIQRGPTPEPLCQVMLRVGDLERSIKFYEKVSLIICHFNPIVEEVSLVYLFGLLFYIQALGMRVVKKTDRPEQKVILNSYCMFSCGVQVL